MWTINLLRVRKARRAAVAVISPMVERSRRSLGAIPDATWSDPYVVGFIMMLITMVAKAASEKIDGDALCIVQETAWRDITRRRLGPIGEDVVLFSEGNNPEFDLGCHDAMSFGPILACSRFHCTETGANWTKPDPRELEGVNVERENLFAAWARLFETHISSCDSGASIST